MFRRCTVENRFDHFVRQLSTTDTSYSKRISIRTVSMPHADQFLRLGRSATTDSRKSTGVWNWANRSDEERDERTSIYHVDFSVVFHRGEITKTAFARVAHTVVVIFGFRWLLLLLLVFIVVVVDQTFFLIVFPMASEGGTSIASLLKINSSCTDTPSFSHSRIQQRWLWTRRENGSVGKTVLEERANRTMSRLHWQQPMLSNVWTRSVPWGFYIWNKTNNQLSLTCIWRAIWRGTRNPTLNEQIFDELATCDRHRSRT